MKAYTHATLRQRKKTIDKKSNDSFSLSGMKKNRLFDLWDTKYSKAKTMSLYTLSDTNAPVTAKPSMEGKSSSKTYQEAAIDFSNTFNNLFDQISSACRKTLEDCFERTKKIDEVAESLDQHYFLAEIVIERTARCKLGQICSQVQFDNYVHHNKVDSQKSISFISKFTPKIKELSAFTNTSSLKTTNEFSEMFKLCFTEVKKSTKENNFNHNGVTAALLHKGIVISGRTSSLWSLSNPTLTSFKPVYFSEDGSLAEMLPNNLAKNIEAFKKFASQGPRIDKTLQPSKPQSSPQPKDTPNDDPLLPLDYFLPNSQSLSTGASNIPSTNEGSTNPSRSQSPMTVKSSKSNLKPQEKQSNVLSPQPQKQNNGKIVDPVLGLLSPASAESAPLFNDLVSQKYLYKVEALYEYNASSDKELSFKVGDVIEVLQEHQNGWNVGSINGKEGYIPSNYVKRINR